MTPYEIMLSESQERMLLVVHARARSARSRQVFEKWDLHAVRIGRSPPTAVLRVRDHGSVVADIPNTRAGRRGAALRSPDAAARVARRGAAARRWRRSGRRRRPRGVPTPCSRRRTSRASGGSTASTTTWCAPTRSRCPTPARPCVRVKGTSRALAMSVDGNGRYCYLDPREGAQARRGRGGAQRRVCRRPRRSARRTT